MRISNRMKNMSSSLNQKNFVREYSKSQQIKNRLMRYSSNEAKVYLKSERYFNENSNQSMVSNDKDSSSSKKFAIKPTYRKSAINHYNRDDIVKNKVDISTSNLAGIKAKYNRNNRPNTSMDANLADEEGTFFATEPKRNRLKSFKRKVNLA